ncbi:MAG: zinc chelation protein SecC, partial [Selenomonadaceae bacterium]|nr:zinc chelation protein SecC [Selenomonadaceae bacterium]
MKPKEIDITKELENLEAAAKEERRKQLYRHKLPEKRDLRSALSGMTKTTLEDICYNLNVTGISSLKKDELVERLAEAVPEFSRRWFPSMLEEEYGCFRHIMEHSGISTELRDDDI